MATKTYTSNGYTYTVDDNGTVVAKGVVSENPTSRQGMSSINPDGYDSKTEDKGHLIAAQEGGVAAEYNVSSMDRGLNRGAYKTVENAEIRIANKEGYTVETEKTSYVSNPGEKPSAYMVNDTITTPDGKVHTINSSFTNMSKSDVEKIEDEMEDIPMEDYPNPDPLRESMTPEEHNQLMEETNQHLGSVKDEYDVDNMYSSQTENLEGNGAKEIDENGVIDNDAENFEGDAPSLNTTEPDTFDNDAENFDGAAPSLGTMEVGSSLDNDAEDFEGDAPSCDSSVGFDTGEGSGGGLDASVDDGLGSGSEGGMDDGADAGGADEGMD